uniref:Uncharacterized protein n=1 Tax=Daphnia magna TaxID=35525 RepID=A0A0P6JDR7_9CRUS
MEAASPIRIDVLERKDTRLDYWRRRRRVLRFGTCVSTCPFLLLISCGERNIYIYTVYIGVYP